MKKILIHHNYKRESLETKGNLIRLLNNNGYEVVDENPDLIVVIGGDGTMLSAVRDHRLKKIPFIGVNTGNLGFLPSIRPDRMEDLLDVIESKNINCNPIHYSRCYVKL